MGMARRRLPSPIVVSGCYTCDYIDVGKLDREFVSHCTVPLLSSTATLQCRGVLVYLDWVLVYGSLVALPSYPILS